MKIMVLGITAVTSFWISAYIFNFARWSWRKKNRRGAVGLLIIALLTAVFPLTMLVWRAYGDGGIF